MDLRFKDELALMPDLRHRLRRLRWFRMTFRSHARLSDDPDLSVAPTPSGQHRDSLRHRTDQNIRLAMRPERYQSANTSSASRPNKAISSRSAVR